MVVFVRCHEPADFPFIPFCRPRLLSTLPFVLPIPLLPRSVVCETADSLVNELSFHLFLGFTAVSSYFALSAPFQAPSPPWQFFRPDCSVKGFLRPCPFIVGFFSVFPPAVHIRELGLGGLSRGLSWASAGRGWCRSLPANLRAFFSQLSRFTARRVFFGFWFSFPQSKRPFCPRGGSVSRAVFPAIFFLTCCRNR